MCPFSVESNRFHGGPRAKEPDMSHSGLSGPGASYTPPTALVRWGKGVGNGRVQLDQVGRSRVVPGSRRATGTPAGAAATDIILVIRPSPASLRIASWIA